MKDYGIIQDTWGNLFAPQISEALSSYVGSNSYRLDAGVYSSEMLKTLDSIKTRNLRTLKLSDITEIFMPPLLKRTYIQDLHFGISFLSSSEMMEFDPQSNVISKADCQNWQLYEVRKGFIAISRSGTIGNITIIPSKWDRWCLTEDAIRVISRKGYLGLVYSFLRLPWMRDLIVGKKSGSVIDHIYEDDLKQLEVPIPTQSCIDELESTINKVLILREESDELLSRANSLIIEINGLPILHESEAAWLDPDRNIESVLISSSAVFHNNHSGSEYRLDAHYYNPLAQLAIRNIRQSKCAVKTIDDVTERVFMCNRFKRNYVDEKYGVPFLSGKNIIQIRPTDLKHISLSETTDLDDLKLEATWTLITRSGTIGRTCFVWKNYEDYSATEHIVRVVPNKEEIDPGYLYAFLSSPYGKQQVLRFTHGSVIDEVSDKQIKKVLLPLSSNIEQKKIGDLVRAAYEKRAEAIRLEDEAQKILMDALTQ